jgi:hypothetical protein
VEKFLRRQIEYNQESEHRRQQRDEGAIHGSPQCFELNGGKDRNGNPVRSIKKKWKCEAKSAMDLLQKKELPLLYVQSGDPGNALSAPDGDIRE